MKCQKCDSEAVLADPLTREPLCFRCFEQRLLSRVRRNLTTSGLTPFSRILLAMSGGKDSSVMSMLTTKIEREFPKVELVGVTIDEGIEGYRGEGIEIAKKLAKNLGIEHRVYSMKKIIGYTVTEAVNINSSLGACTYCGVFRRRALDYAALELDADFIAVGHNLSDIVQTLIMNILRGEKNKLLGVDLSWPLVPRIWPIRTLTESMVTLYAYLARLDFQEVECPYSHDSFRDPIRRFVLEMESKYPGALYSALSIKDQLNKMASIKYDELKKCPSCGYPTSRDICRVCEIKRLLDKKS
ncbi:MAG: TIGR00269 family protein [Candidatus Korarchaeota archaeon]